MMLLALEGQDVATISGLARPDLLEAFELPEAIR